MPSLGADMEAGTIDQWLVKPGDQVHRGDIVAVVETEKSTIEIEVFENGVVEDLVVPEGERVPVGTVLAHLRTEAAPAPAPAPAPTSMKPAAHAPQAAQPATPGGAAATLSEPIPPSVHSPVVRHLAEQLHVDLATVSGSGKGGTVTRSDVEHAAAERTAAGGSRPAAPTRRGTRRRPAAATVFRPRSSPFARKLAAELGIDLATLQGTGPGESIVEDDVRRAARVAQPAPIPSATAEEPAGAAASTEDKQAALRHAIGALMARSKREVPHYYLSTTVDAGAATTWLEQANLERPVTSRLVMAALLLKATALAVAKVPEMNGFFADDRFTPSEAVHVGVAISMRSGGVIAPALHDTNLLSLDELMAKLRDLVGRARSGVLRSSEMSDPTITVTNLGELGVESVFGVIYPPQVALVGFGQLTERVVVREGMLGARPCLTATLSADHRASDGHRGGRFLSEINRLLKEPEKL